MGKDLLSEVIEVEKEIQKRLELEKIKSRDWLEQIGKELRQERAKEEKDSEELLRRSLEEAKRDAEVRAADIVKQAEHKVGLLTTLQNGTAMRIVERHIRRILPG